jgi:hypothetical protein
MPLTFTRSWNDEDLERYRDSVVRFIETEMLPDDEAARGRGHVGHAIWRGPASSASCAPTSPRRTAAAAATSATRRCSTRRRRGAA